MSRRSQRNKLKKFIEALPELKNILNIKTNYKDREIIVINDDSIIKFFYHKALDKFLVFRKGNNFCEIEDIKFTHKETARLIELIDNFIFNKNSIYSGVKRIIKRAKDSNLK